MHEGMWAAEHCSPLPLDLGESATYLDLARERERARARWVFFVLGLYCIVTGI